MTSGDRAEAGRGARAPAEGTPFPVDVSPDRRARVTLAVFLAGPVTAIVHFMLVYLIVEAGCTGEGSGLRLFDPPVSDAVTLVVTAVAAAVCMWFAIWGALRWRGRGSGDTSERLDAPDPDGALAFIGAVLSLISFVTVLLVGMPSLFLPAC